MQIHMCRSVCVVDREIERQRDRDREIERQRDRETEIERQTDEG